MIVLYLLSTIALFASCKTQPNSRDINNDLKVQQSEMTPADTVKELGANVMTIYQDKKNNYWFASWENGLYRYDGKTILHYTTRNGLPDNRIEEIKEDNAGNLYINTSKGVCKFDGQSFTTLSPALFGNEWKLTPNDLWFRGSWDLAFVYRYDGNALYKLDFPKHPNYSNPYAVYSIYKDSKGNVWFGTNPVGAFRYDGKSIDWISEEDVTELHNGPANGVRSIIEDKDGYFWFNSAFRYGVYGKSNTQKNSFYTRVKSFGNLDGSPDSDFWEYMSIARDNNGDLWMATYGNGVWKYNGTKTTYYPVQADGKDITVFSIYKDNHGGLWLGTHEHGAYKLNGNTFEQFRL